MTIWIRRSACTIIAVGVVIGLPLGLSAASQGITHYTAGSEVYIEQPPKRALEKKETGIGGKDGDSVLRPAEGPELPASKHPEACDQQNTPSQACYTATQQARPIPR